MLENSSVFVSKQLFWPSSRGQFMTKPSWWVQETRILKDWEFSVQCYRPCLIRNDHSTIDWDLPSLFTFTSTYHHQRFSSNSPTIPHDSIRFILVDTFSNMSLKIVQSLRKNDCLTFLTTIILNSSWPNHHGESRKQEFWRTGNSQSKVINHVWPEMTIQR